MLLLLARENPFWGLINRRTRLYSVLHLSPSRSFATALTCHLSITHNFNYSTTQRCYQIFIPYMEWQVFSQKLQAITVHLITYTTNFIASFSAHNQMNDKNKLLQDDTSLHKTLPWQKLNNSLFERDTSAFLKFNFHACFLSGCTFVLPNYHASSMFTILGMFL